jgi:MFS superfamily sulfate permease-like transporter
VFVVFFHMSPENIAAVVLGCIALFFLVISTRLKKYPESQGVFQALGLIFMLIAAFCLIAAIY